MHHHTPNTNPRQSIPQPKNEIPVSHESRVPPPAEALGDVQHPEQSGQHTPSSLNPAAPEFVPFALRASTFDVDDDLLDDAEAQDFGTRIEHMVHDQQLWSRFCESDLSGSPPPPCECHGLPRGACPEVKAYFVDRISRGLEHSGLTPNMDSLREPLKFQNFPLENWEWALSGYFDAHEILQGFRFGWDVSFTSEPKPKDAQYNLQGASLFQKDVQHYVDQESRFGSLVGPFDPSKLPFKVYCSPLNTVNKKGSKVRRTVVDCTQLDKGVNAFIDAHHHRGKDWKLSLPTSATIIKLIQETRQKYPGERVFLFKIDFSRWYRWFTLDPVSSIFFAIRWRGQVYLDTALSFGNRAAALAAQRVIWAVIWIYRTRIPSFPGTFNSGVTCSCTGHCDCGDNKAAGYIDDFMGASPQSLAHINFDAALGLADTLGLRISKTPGHVSPPSAICECLGITYDTDRNVMLLPQDKVDALSQILQDWLSKTITTEHELAVLAGKLLFASQVIASGRLFLNRCLATKRRAARHNGPIMLDEDFRADIRWWQNAIKLHNGVSFLVPEATIHISLDASTDGWYQGKPGLGAYNHSTHEYFSEPAPEHLEELGIADLELLAHVAAVHLWGPAWHGHEVAIHTDNQATYYLLRNGRSRDDRRLRMSRSIATQGIQHQFRIISEWIPTTENTLADALSRVGDPAQRRKFQQHCDELGGTPRQRPVRPEHFSFD